MLLSYRHTRPAFQRYLQALRLPWSKPQRGNLLLLGTAFLAERRLPLRCLARSLAGPQQSHRHLDKRLRRFLGNDRLDGAGGLAAYLAFLLPRFGPLPAVPVVLDWTWVGRTYAVLWAQIPYRGRSFPLWAQVRSAAQYGDTATESALLQQLQQAWPTDAPPPLLLADGAFPKPTLLTWLEQHGWAFVIRGRQTSRLYPAAGPRLVLSVPPGEQRVYVGAEWRGVYPLPLQVVVTARAQPTGPRYTWVLLTNLPEAKLAWVPQLYAHRMQPEQTHRDSKRGHFVSGYALAHLKRLRAERLERLLFCLGLVYGFLVLLAETERDARAWLQRRHWGLSLATFGLDLIRAAGHQLLRLTKQALDCVRWEPLWPETGDS